MKYDPKKFLQCLQIEFLCGIINMYYFLTPLPVAAISHDMPGGSVCLFWERTVFCNEPFYKIPSAL